MKIAICDDMQEDREAIKIHLEEYRKKMNINFDLSFFESGESLLNALKKTTFKVIFLDIYMEKLTGIDTAKEIRKFDKKVHLIFTTTSPDHAVSSYDVRALHYILKPISYSKMEKVLNLCQFEDIKESKQIEILTGKNYSNIKLSEIIYAEVYQKNLAIHTTYGIVESKTSLENFEVLIGGSPFLKCHRSFIVNMDYIKDVMTDTFILNNNESVPISRPSKVLTIKTYNEYIFSGLRKKLW